MEMPAVCESTFGKIEPLSSSKCEVLQLPSGGLLNKFRFISSSEESYFSRQ